MAEQYTNIRLILDKLMRHPLLQDISLETVVDYTVDFMRIVGVPNMFIENICKLEVEEWRTKLPKDYHSMIQVREADSLKTFRYSTDTFHVSDNDTKSIDFSYKIQGDIIYTSIKECEIEIAYNSILIDEEGYPLLPDNSSFTRALELYIKKQWFTILFELGKIGGQILQNTQQEYAWAVGDCQTEFNRLSLDKAESFFNSWRTLLIRGSEHSHNFRNNGVKERLKLQ